MKECHMENIENMSADNVFVYDFIELFYWLCLLQ